MHGAGLDMKVIQQVIKHHTSMIILIYFVRLILITRILRPGVTAEALSEG